MGCEKSWKEFEVKFEKGFFNALSTKKFIADIALTSNNCEQF